MTAVNPLTFTKAVRDGFAQLIAENSDGALSWSPTAGYAKGVTGVWTSAMPAEPDRLVVVSCNQLSADPTLSNAVWNIKFRTRGAAGAGQDDADALVDVIENALGGRFPLTLATGVRVSSLAFSYGGSLGVDTRNRWESSTNWTATIGRPGTYRH